MISVTACDWDPLFADCAEDGSCSHLDSMPADVAEAVQTSAIEWLWDATFRRYGNCPVTILPCKRTCSGYGSWPAWLPYRTAGGWTNVDCGRCGNDCSCSSVDQIILPTIGTVLGVESNGIPLPSTSWRLDNHRLLVRIDGGEWATCQDLSYEETPTLAVIYVPGLEVPSMGRLAAGTLICQLARRYCGAKCDLPANTSSVSRQGVTIAIDPQAETGLWVVDQWVEIANRATPRVYSPDVPILRTAETLTSP